MSVLNKMLRDLEQRQAKTGIASGHSIAPTATPRWQLALLALCMAVFSAWLAVTALAGTAKDMANTRAAPGQISELAAEPRLTTRPPASDVAVMTITGKETPLDSASLADAIELTAPAEPQTSAAAQPPVSPAAQVQPSVSDKPDARLTEPVATARTAGDATRHFAPAARGITPQRTDEGVVQVERAGQTLAQQRDALQQQAIAATQAGQLQQALQLWHRLQLLAPDSAESYLAQARLWLQLGQPARAEQVVLQGVQQGLVSAELQLLLAQQAAGRAQWQQVDMLLPARFALAEYPEYYGLKATALQQLGQQQAALHWFSQLIVQQPQQARWWLGAAIALDAQAQHEQAQQHFRQALQWGNSLSPGSRNYIQQRLAAIE